MKKVYSQSLILSVLLLAGFVPGLQAAFVITSPTASQSVSGPTLPLQVSGWPVNTARVEYMCDAYSCYAPGHGAPYADPILAPLYAYGKAITAPYTVQWNTFWLSNGAHVLTATAYDVNGSSLATATQSFTVANTWPVKCTDGSAPASSVSIGTFTAGIVPVTLTVTGSCATDAKSVQVWIDGINTNWGYSGPNTLATWTANIDTTGFSNGPHIIAVTWIDLTNFTTYTNAPSGSGQVGTAGEYSQIVTFANGALPRVVHSVCKDCFLTPSSTVTLNPTLLKTDGTLVSSPTFNYYSANTAVATVNSSGVVTATSACVTYRPCSALVYAQSPLASQSATDGNNTIGFTSATVTFTPRAVGELLVITGGACAGSYVVTSGDFRVNTIATSPALPTTCTGMTFALGPTSVENIPVWPTNTMPHFGNDGAIHTAYAPGVSMFMHSIFDSSLWLGNPSGALAPTPSYSYRGATGPLAEFDALGGYNTWEIGILPQTCDGYNTATQSAYQASLNSYIGAFSTPLATLTHAKYVYGIGDNVMRGAAYLWGCGDGPQSGSGGATVGGNTPWTTPIMAVTLGSWKSALSAFSSAMPGINLQDEVSSSWNVCPLCGPIVPGGTNSWLTSIVCAAGTCTIHGANISINSTLQIVITGSVTTGMNTAPGAALAVSGAGGSSVTFAQGSIPTGTYNSSNDPGLTISPYAAGGYTFNSNTSYISNDAFSRLIQQANTLGAGRINITAAPPTVGGCTAFANWMGNGTSGPLGGISQFGQYADFYPDNSQYQGYLAASNAIDWLVTGGSNGASVGAFTRSEYGCYSPSLPLITITNTGEGAFSYAGSSVGITSQTNDVITFSAPHGVANVVPGETRLTVAGSSNTPFNTNFYVLGVLSPTQLRVAYAATTFVGSPPCTNGTITFSPGGYTETPTSISASGTNPGPNFGQDYALFGEVFKLTTQDTANLLRQRGKNMAITGCTDTNYAANNWVYLAENVNNILKPWYAFRQLPSGSGTGGTATILLDSTTRAGISGQQRPGEWNPEYVYASYNESLIVRSIGVRGYIAGSAPYYTYSPTSGFVSAGQSGVFYPSIFPTSPLALSSNAQAFPHWENSAAVPSWHAANFAALHANRWQKYYIQPAVNSPDYSPTFDCTVRMSSYGNLLHCLNNTDGPQTQIFTLTPYLQSGQQIIQENTGADGTDVITVLSSGTSTSTVTVNRGGSVFFAFPVTFAGELNQPSVSVRLADITGATGVSIRWGYDDYLLDVPRANVVNCGSTFPCTLGADKNFGTVYGRIYYYNSGGAVIATSDVQPF